MDIDTKHFTCQGKMIMRRKSLPFSKPPELAKM
jgi:hypothetical protein